MIMNNETSIFPCVRGVMGDWVYYSTLMTAEQVSNHISTAKSIREAKSLDDYLQRDLTKNVKKIYDYLINNESKMFNSMIIGVFDAIPDWLSFDLNKSEKLDNFPETSKKYLSESIGLLIFNGTEKMFAIDGQHRAEAIKNTFNDKKERVCDDQYPVIFVAHKDDDNGKRRSRKLFADINKKAVKVSQGDLIIIDEEEPSSIVARRVYSNSPYFSGGNIISLTKNANLGSNDTDHFTNLLTIDRVVKILKPLHIGGRLKLWQDTDLNKLTEIVNDFFDIVFKEIDEYKSYFIHKNTELVVNRYKQPNLLFRPIGLTLLARIYKFFKLRNEIGYFKDHINKIDFSLPGIHFNGVVWNNGRMETKYQTVAYLLSLYLLNRLDQDETHGVDGLEAKFDLATKNSRKLPQKVV